MSTPFVKIVIIKNQLWQMNGSDYGMKYVRKAMSHAKKNSKVLDIGCGSNAGIINEGR